MTKKSKYSLAIALFIMATFFVSKTLVVFGIISHFYGIEVYEYICFLSFCPPFYIFVKDYLSQLKKVHQETVDQLQYKNTYLEHAAKILRHDMHSGINVYIPRGVISLERRLDKETISKLKLEAPLKLLKEGLTHTQKIYKGVYEFTNLVKQGTQLIMDDCNLRDILIAYLETTAYKEQVIIDMLPNAKVNEPLFCTAIDNLIRNGLKYNDNQNKMVVIFMLDDNTMAIQDNGRGMSHEEFLLFSKNNMRRENQKEKGSGLGLGICIAILREHGFDVSCEKLEEGSMLKIKLKKD